MSFFGLTALGPQNSLQVSLADFSYINVFTDDDMAKAFKAVIDKDRLDYLDIHQAQTFLSELYHGTPRACDLARFLEKANTVGDSRLSLDDIRSLMNQLKKEVKEETKKNKWKRGSGSDFNSNQSFREKVRRHERIARGPRERYANTVTATQEHGWKDQLDVNRQMVHSKKSCPETVYASELIKNGIYF